MAEIDFHIIGIQITDRNKEAGQVQSTLTSYGNTIRTRLGLTDIEDDSNSSGIILVDLYGDNDEKKRFENDLEKIKGIDVQKMIF
jgi:hypothetical protein